MPIVSFIDPKTGQIVTRVRELTNKNIVFAEINFGFVDYLYEEALKILATNIGSRYTTYYKKKRSGKLRRIDAPDEGLKKYMKEVKDFFAKRLGFIFPECVSAYVKHRSAKQAAQKHVGAYAIFKFDIENFFGSCTLENIMYALQSIYPFCLMDDFKLETIIKACMISYDGEFRLPQGAPSSPLISNLAMIPADITFSELLGFTYTRFADDITFSVKFQANRETFCRLERKVSARLLAWGFKINKSKTRFLKTYYGNVKVLGISVGAKGINIGNKDKQCIKAQIWSFLQDTRNGKIWPRKEVQQLEGRVSQFKHIEPDFISSVIKKYEIKTNVSYKKSVKNILCSK